MLWRGKQGWYRFVVDPLWVLTKEWALLMSSPCTVSIHCYIHVQFRLCAWVMLTLLLHRCMWFPFASLQVFFCNKFPKDFALTLAVTPAWPFPAPEPAERGLFSSACPGVRGGDAARTRSEELCEVRRSLKGGS